MRSLVELRRQPRGLPALARSPLPAKHRVTQLRGLFFLDTC
jgi:hypothetical protein